MDRLIRILWRQSHAIGFSPSIVCASAWIVCPGALLLFISPALAQSPMLFWFCVVVIVSLTTALGSLVSFWILMSHVKFRKRGYQVIWLKQDEWVYEERVTDGSVEYLPLFRKITGDGYPAPCSVHIRSEESWEQQAPQWARGRRTEILNRIAEQFGGRVQFYDADSPDSEGARFQGH